METTTVRTSLAGLLLIPVAAVAAETEPLPRCEVVPLENRRVSLRVDGVERVSWHFRSESPRPFFFPFNGPSGTSLTRMGHPGAPDHDHHRSVWFAHDKVNGQSFWNDHSGTRIRQKQWLGYRDGDDECIASFLTGWYDKDGEEVMEQVIISSLRPEPDGEHSLEIQLTVRPPKGVERVELGRTNFGFLAVRVAKSLSEYFGGGRLSDSEGRQGEPSIFGQRARWMDYSGPVAIGIGADRRSVIEGITLYDHPTNPRHPTRWHVREDGWMGASFFMDDGFTATHDSPLTLRYLLHAHRGAYAASRSEAIFRAFGRRAPFHIERSKRKHIYYEVNRRDE